MSRLKLATNVWRGANIRGTEEDRLRNPAEFTNPAGNLFWTGNDHASNRNPVFEATHAGFPSKVLRDVDSLYPFVLGSKL